VPQRKKKRKKEIVKGLRVSKALGSISSTTKKKKVKIVHFVFAKHGILYHHLKKCYQNKGSQVPPSLISRYSRKKCDFPWGAWGQFRPLSPQPPAPGLLVVLWSREREPN
jgi:hypothetical protein